jgi:23S rRNA (adenine-N6)-dimethyltransferase
VSAPRSSSGSSPGRSGSGRGRPGSRPARSPRPASPAAGQGRPPRTDQDRRRRELSQNYLRSPGAAEQFLRAVRIDPDGLCLEVGAGEGILTERLAGMCRELVAYELDENLAGSLTARLAGRSNVRVVIGDFLAARPPRTPFQVVGNAPFSVTSPIVDWCLDASALTSATLITQLEYARKRTGGYGRWSLLTVSTWPQVRWELRGTIPRTQFRPVPRVDAGILHLARRPEPLIPARRMGAYQRAVRAGFSGVGGTLLASLRREYPAGRLGPAFGAAGIDRGAVVAFVSPDQWVELFRFLDREA